MSEDLKNIIERLEKLEKENLELKEKLSQSKQTNKKNIGIPVLEKNIFRGLMLAVSGSYSEDPDPEIKLENEEIAALKSTESTKD